MKIVKYILLFFILILLYNLSLYLICLLPKTQNLYQNCMFSAFQLTKEGDFFTPFFVETIDNASDAIIINEAYSIDNTSPLKSYLLMRRSYDTEYTTKESKDQFGDLITYSSDSTFDDGIFISGSKYFSHCQELLNYMLGNVKISVEYARYWHGYMIIYRPLLYFLNITQINILLLGVFVILFLITINYIKKHLGRNIAIIYGIAMFCCGSFIACISLQQAPTLLLTLIFSVIVLKLSEKHANFIPYLFFIIGSLICFFDFLTVPILTLCMPAFLLSLTKKKNGTIAKENFTSTIAYSFLWLVGYVITWIAKWGIVYFVLNTNIFQSALSQVLYRISGPVSDIKNNVMYLLNFITFPLYTTAIIILIANNLFSIKKKSNSNSSFKHFVMTNYDLITIAIIPILWLIVTKNHILSHPHFTYRNTMPLVLLILYYFISYKRDSYLPGLKK